MCMRWIYKIQQHMAITATECWALVTLMGLLGLGLVAQEYQEQRSPVNPDQYAVLQTAFQSALADTSSTQDTLAVLSSDPLILPSPVSIRRDTLPRRRQKAKGPPARMNINTASKSQLMRLPGIGPSLAERVIAFRTTNGPFNTPDALIRVKGIGRKKLAKMRPYIFIADSTHTP